MIHRRGPHCLLKDHPLCEGLGLHVGVRGILSGHHRRHPLEPFPPPQEGAVVKHVLRLGVQGPEVPLTRVTRLSWHLDKAVIEAQIMADGVLPLGESVPIVGEPLLDKFADAVKGEPPLGGLDYGHGDEGDVGVGRLAVIPVITERLLVLVTAVCPALLKVIFRLNLDVHVVGGNTGLIPSPSCSHIFIT